MVQDQPTLKGKTVAITRPCGQAEEEAEIIRREGGIPYFMPTITIKASSNRAPIKKLITELATGKTDHVIFMSVNGVNHLFAAAETMHLRSQLEEGLQKTTVTAVGPRTAQELRSHNIRVDLVPAKYTSEGVLDTLMQQGVQDRVIRIPRTPAASPALMEKLRKLGALVEEVYVYESEAVVDHNLAKRFLGDLTDGRIDGVVFGSSMCVRNLFLMLNEFSSAEQLRDLLNRKQTAIVAIGPVTADTLRGRGVKVDVMPKEHVFEAALIELAHYWSSQ
ncbi:MAG: uroporphyrinogen-III synthase [Candidatus Bathyarchaeota archaeon]|nr:uroporphyrinogen-III synthase [Candidatus Bathyarchaeota archaeon]